MRRKFHFYETYGVKEYIVLDPEKERESFQVWEREGDHLIEVNGCYWRSTLLGIEIRKTDHGVKVYRPDGSPFIIAQEEKERGDREKELRERALEKMQKMEEELNILRAKLKDEDSHVEFNQSFGCF